MHVGMDRQHSASSSLAGRFGPGGSPLAATGIPVAPVAARNLRSQRRTWSVGRIFLGWSALLAATAVATTAAGDPDGQLAPVTLGEVWAAAAEVRSAEASAAAGQAAGEMLERALELERLPQLTLSAGGDGGQRARPGEERGVGVGVRGDAVAELSWNLRDGSREPRAEVVRQQRREAEWRGRMLADERRAQLAEVFVQGDHWRRRHELQWQRQADTEGLLEAAGHRRAAGIDTETEFRALADAVAQGRRDLAEARQQWVRWTVELSSAAGAAVGPVALDLRAERAMPATAVGPVSEADAPPAEVGWLEQQARTSEARAEVERRGQGLRLDIVGSAGPYASQAFDRAIEPEYYLGLRASWQPDLSGERRRRAEAEQLRALALREEAEGRRRELQRTRDALGAWWTEQRAARELIDAEEQAAEEFREVAELRWRRGVGGWMELLRATDRRHEVRQRRLEMELELARVLIEYAAVSGRLDELPAWLGRGAR